MAFGVLGLLNISRLQQFHWLRESPDWLVGALATSKVSPVKRAAGEELLDRLRQGEFSQEEVRILQHKILRMPDSAATEMNWPDAFVYAAWSQQLLQRDDRDEYLSLLANQQGALIIENGDDTEVIDATERRSFSFSAHFAPMQTQFVEDESLRRYFLANEILVNGVPRPTSSPFVYPDAMQRRRMYTLASTGKISYAASTQTIGPGNVVVRGEVILVECIAPSESELFFGESPSVKREDLRRFTREIARVPFEITRQIFTVPLHDSVRMTTAGVAVDDILAHLTVVDAFATRNSNVGYGVSSGVRIDDSPVDVAFDICWRVGGIEHSIAHIACRRGESATARPHAQLICTDPIDDTVDIVLRPSTAFAHRYEMNEIWAGEITIEDVSIRVRESDSSRK